MIGNRATLTLLKAGQTPGAPPMIQREGDDGIETKVMSFQSSLAFFRQLEAKGGGKSAPKTSTPETKQPDQPGGPVEEPVGEAPKSETPTDTPSTDSTSEPEAKSIEDLPEAKSNKDEDELVSLGDDSQTYEGKELGETYQNQEKAYHKKGSGFAYATWTEGNVPIKYIDDETERETYELKLHKGKNLFFWRGAPLDTSKMRRMTAFGGSNNAARVIYVMTTGGKIYVADEGAETIAGENSPQQYRFNHSSLVEGEPVASAGELWFEDGILKGISDKSGHYRPGLQETLQVLRHFQKLGVDISNVVVDRFEQEPIYADALLKYGAGLQARNELRAFRFADNLEQKVKHLSSAFALAPDMMDYTLYAQQIYAKASEEVEWVLKQLQKKEKGKGRSLGSIRDTLVDAEDAFKLIAQVAPNLIPSDLLKQVDELWNNISTERKKGRKGGSKDDRDYGALVGQAQDILTSIGTVDKPTFTDLEKSVSQVKDPERDTYNALYDKCQSLLENPYNIGGIVDLYGIHRQALVQPLKAALYKKGISVDEYAGKTLPDWIKDLADGIGSALGTQLANALKPGSVTKEHLVNKVGEDFAENYAAASAAELLETLSGLGMDSDQLQKNAKEILSGVADNVEELREKLEKYIDNDKVKLTSIRQKADDIKKAIDILTGHLPGLEQAQAQAQALVALIYAEREKGRDTGRKKDRNLQAILDLTEPLEDTLRALVPEDTKDDSGNDDTN